MRIKHRDKLLGDLAYELNDRTRKGWDPKVNGIKVVLSQKNGDQEAAFYGLAIVLHYLVEDINTDGDQDWSEADRVEMDTY